MPRSRARFVALHLVLFIAALGGCGSDDDDTPPDGRPAQVLVQGASLIGGGAGIFFDADDRLYVATGSQSITVLDPDSGRILDRLGPEVGVAFPDDLTIAPDGSLYWTEILFGRVHGMTPDGETFVLADGLFGVNPITISDHGELFFAQCFNPEGNGIFRGDPTGASPPVPILEGIEGCAGNGMDWWDDALYVPRLFEDRIVRVDLATGEMTDVTVGFPVPTAVKFDSEGNLHAISTATGEVVRVDRSTGERTIIARLGPGIDNLAFDSRDRLFVSSPPDASIVEVLASGATRVVSAEGLGMPTGLAVVGDVVYAGGFGSVRGFDVSDGEPVSVVRGALAAPGPLPFVPASLATLGEDLVMAELFGTRIARWSPSVGETISVSEPFGQVVDVEPFLDGVAVTDMATGSVVLATGPDFSERTLLATGLVMPTGLAASGSDLYVSDVVLGTVMRIVRDGEPLESPEQITTAALAGPEGMAVRPTGEELVVVEGGTGLLKEIDLRTGAVTIVASELSILPPLEGFLPFHFLNDVIIDGDGTLYVNGDGAAVIYSF